MPLVAALSSTFPSSTYTKVFFVPLVDVKLKLLALNMFVPLFLKYNAVDFILSFKSIFNTDSLEVVGSGITALFADLPSLYAFPPSRSAYPKNPIPTELFPEISIALFNNISELK